MAQQTFNISAAESSIRWTGRKVTGAHYGTIGIKKGWLTTSNGILTGGHFIVDITSIKIEDVTDPATNAQFAGHLASDDFFSTSQHPEAFFEIKAVDDNHIKGDLTIKGITHPVSFTANTTITEEELHASGTIIIDRTKYGIKFRSGNFFQNLGDTLIYNDFELKVDLTAQKAK